MQEQHAQTVGADHIGLTVGDLEQSRRFFVECLGWQVIGGVPAYPAVFVSDGTVGLSLWEVDKSATAVAFDRRKNIGLHHLALKVPDASTLQNIYARVSAWPGVQTEFAPEPVAADGSRTHCMVREPGGTRLEFVCTLTD
jgi:catechol 2,3-dioxygenase-like lactoylglutathione lyase family enzyme